MATIDPKRVSDGALTLERGIDSGKAPNLVAQNQASFAINTTFRGGWGKARPGWKKVTLNFEDEIQSDFEGGYFQDGDGYVYDDGRGALISMHGGRVYRAAILNNGQIEVQDISIAGDPNASNTDRAWSLQAENYFIIQDGQSKPFIYNGGSSRRAIETEIPVAKQMAYYMGRIWLANGREYVAGDIIYNPDSGSSALGFRDSILKMTENTYIAEGGAFSVPVSAGNITGLKPIANINTALGQGELIVFTEGAVFATLVPQDRAQWKNTTQPLQRMIQLAQGCFSQSSIVNVNEDLFYRANDGIRSLAFSVRNSGQWGNTPISNEMERILPNDAQAFLHYASGVNFDNRLLMTCVPGVTRNHGNYFKALAALDFDLITSMGEKSPPAWEGIWTGLNFLKIVTVKHNGIERCFGYVLNSEAKIEIWELTKDAYHDYNGSEDVRIQWSIEYRSMDFRNKFDLKQLFSGDLFFDQLRDTVDFDVDFRPDSYPCWIDWDNWTECSKNSMCADEFGTCVTLPNYQEQYRPMRQLVQPTDAFDPILKTQYRKGYEFQVRLTVVGRCRAKQLRINAYEQQQKPYGSQL